MPVVHHARREVTLKLVYCGAGLSGKTTNLRELHSQSQRGRRGKLISLMTDAERTLFFDFLPLSLGEFRGYRFRVHVCSVPGQVAQDATRRRVLRHVDGVVLVVDRQPRQIEANAASVRDLVRQLSEHEVELERVPLVLQYNKSDLPEALEVEALREALGVPEQVPEVQASAQLGWGVFESLKAVVKECLREMPNPASLEEGYSACRRRHPRQRFYPAHSSSMIQALKPAPVEPVVKSSAKE